MDPNTLSAYNQACITLVTKHAKSIAIAPPLKKRLNASVIEYVIDTDQFGTFSGDVARLHSAKDTAQKKCLCAIQQCSVPYALASEGSFGSHPHSPFVTVGSELLYFIDSKREFELCVFDTTTDIQCQQQDIQSKHDINPFAERVGFPAQGIILKASHDEQLIIRKDFWKINEIEAAFDELEGYNLELCTDMRAHRNPKRMQHLSILAEKLAKRLDQFCPECNLPGWGVVDMETGLPCSECGMGTDCVASHIHGCVKCDYRERQALPHQQYASAEFCQSCNP